MKTIKIIYIIREGNFSFFFTLSVNLNEKKYMFCRVNIFFNYYLLFFPWVMKMNDEISKLILENRNLIYSIIYKLHGKENDDLFQVGCIGLLNAYRSYKKEYNVKFTTYAYQFIFGEMYKYINNNRNIRLSPDNVKLYHQICQTEEYLINHLGRIPTDDEICNFLEIDMYKLAEIRNLTNTISLDNEFNNYNNFQEQKLSYDELIDLNNAINTLDDNEKKLLWYRYYNNVTQSDYAKIYHMNQVKVSREEKKILSKLKAKMY